MSFRRFSLAGFGIALSILAGCGGSNTGVRVVAPGSKHELNNTVPDDGQYTLYRAYGFNSANHPTHVERVWTVAGNRNEPMGFRWLMPDNRYEPNSAMRLQAYVGSRTRDLGPLAYRDEKYLWAGANADIGGYWQAVNNEDAGKKLTLQ